MPVRNQDWYDLSESRPWPLSDEASGLDDAGFTLPGRFISDLKISFPDTAGRRAMLSAVTVTPNIITVLIVAVNDVNDPGTRTPLAAVSLSKLASTIVPHRQYPIEALYPGTGGWIVFGTAATAANSESYTGRFTDPAQAILQPSTAKAYRNFPVQTMSRLGALQQLTGLVRLRGGEDIEIVKECREIPNNPVPLGQPACDPVISTLRDVIVIRLKETTVVSGIATNQAQSNLFSRYAGPCAGRPESRSCGEPEPIEQLSSVLPDCCGNIDIILKGCAKLSNVTERALVDSGGTVVDTVPACGIIVSCDLGLAEACITADRLPDADGRLPNEYDDLCESITEISETLLPGDEVSQSFSAPEESQSVAADPTLPLCDDFSTNSPNLEIVSGGFSYEGVLGDPGRLYVTPDDSQFTNLSRHTGSYTPFYRRVSARVRINDTFSIRHNASVIAHYRQTSPTSGRYSYYLAEIDWDADLNGFKLFRLAFFDGVRYATELAVAIPSLSLRRYYDILFTIYANLDDPAAAWLEAKLYDTVDDVVLATIGPLAKANFVDAVDEEGSFGMHTIRSSADYETFCIENSSDSPTLGPQP